MAIADEFVCPLGQFYAVDDFEDGSLDTTNKWTVVTSGGASYSESAGAFHSANSPGVGNLPILSAKSMTVSGAFKIAGNFSAPGMEASASNFFGLGIYNGTTWRRGLVLARQSSGLQQIAFYNTSPLSVPVLTSLVTGIAAGTAVSLSIEYDGVSTLTYRRDGAVLMTDTKPSGSPTDLRVYDWRYATPSTPDTRLWYLNWAYFWPYTGADKLACDPYYSVLVSGVPFKVRPWPKPSIQPAIQWIQDASGTWNGSDRGASQDVYEAEVTFTDTDARINALQTLLNTYREGITLSGFNAPIFSPNVDHTGSIACTVVDFGVRERVQWATTSNNIMTVTVVFRAISPTLLGTSPSLSSLKLQEQFSGDHSWSIGKGFSYSQVAAYSDHRSDVGVFRGVFQQTTAQTQAILAYLLTTARASAFTLPTFPGVTYPFGIARGAGPFQCRVVRFSVSRKNLNRWLLEIEFSEVP